MKLRIENFARGDVILPLAHECRVFCFVFIAETAGVEEDASIAFHRDLKFINRDPVRGVNGLLLVRGNLYDPCHALAAQGVDPQSRKAERGVDLLTVRKKHAGAAQYPVLIGFGHEASVIRGVLGYDGKIIHGSLKGRSIFYKQTLQLFVRELDALFIYGPGIRPVFPPIGKTGDETARFLDGRSEDRIVIEQVVHIVRFDRIFTFQFLIEKVARVVVLRQVFKKIFRRGAVGFGKGAVKNDNLRTQHRQVIHEIGQNGPRPRPLPVQAQGQFVNIDDPDTVGCRTG